MTSGVPEREINVILSELSELLDRADTDSFQLRRQEVAVERSWRQQAITPVEYYTCKSFIEFGKYNREAALSAANNVLKLAPSDPFVQCNVLSIRVGILDVDGALSLLRDIASNLRDDRETIKTLIVKSADLLQLETATGLFSLLDKLSVNDAPSQYLRRPAIERSFAAMKRYNFSDADTASRLKAAYSALRDESYDVWRTSRSVLNDGTVLYYFHVKANAEQCALLNFSIADRLVDEFEDPGADFVSFSCRPTSDLSELKGVPGDMV